MPVIKKPEWIRIKANFSSEYTHIKNMTGGMELHTVCEEAGCPNIFECFSNKTATFLILGDKCTRNCKFCLIEKSSLRGLDAGEPLRVAKAVKKLGLRFAVITSVTRDDLPDGGASIFAQTIRQIKRLNNGCEVEVLIPDFGCQAESLKTVVEAGPDVLNHNMETVERLYSEVRQGFSYQRSLKLIEQAKEILKQGFTKSGLIVGMGETKDELKKAITDLSEHRCDILTIGQYLSPSRGHLPVQRYYTPDEFEELKVFSEELGFRKVVSGPLVRSSYHAAAATK